MLEADISEFNAATLQSVQARLTEALRLLQQADLEGNRVMLIARLIHGADAAISEYLDG